MKLNNGFAVDAPTDVVWATILDFERVGRCVPGSEVVGTTDDGIEANVRIKVGPMTMKYRGTVSLVDQDEPSRRAVMRAEARELKGQGTVTATTTIVLHSERPVRIEIDTDLEVTGRVAQMGRGIMQDVAERIVADFAANLSSLIAAESVSRGVEASPSAPSGAPPQSTIASGGDGARPAAANGPAAVTAGRHGSLASPPAAAPISVGRLTVGVLRDRVRAAIARIRRRLARAR